MSEKKSFVEKLMPAVGKMQENIYVSSITGGMMNAMPVLMASAIFQLIYSFPIPAWTNFLQSIGLYGLLTTVVDVCNLTALFIVFGIGRTLGDKKGVDGVQCGLAALLCFLIITPLDVLETGTYISTSSRASSQPSSSPWSLRPSTPSASGRISSSRCRLPSRNSSPRAFPVSRLRWSPLCPSLPSAACSP